jgi:hypothetical protein
VLVDAHDYTLKHHCGTPVAVVVGDEAPAEEAKAAQRIVDFLKSREVPVELLKASQVKVATEKHEVRVDPRDGRRIEGQPVPERDWFLLQTFVNHPIDTGRHMIFVGREDTNRMVKHLGAVDTFTYDKVLEKVTNTYPGAGRGVVQVVDSINFPYFFANSWTRDGILVGGSDAAGTEAAVARFLDLIKDLPKYVPPKVEEKMEIDERPAEER